MASRTAIRGMYFYGLYDDGSGNWGCSTRRYAEPAGTALHDLTTLLTDTGTNAASFAPGALNYTISGTQTRRQFGPDREIEREFLAVALE